MKSTSLLTVIAVASGLAAQSASAESLTFVCKSNRARNEQTRITLDPISKKVSIETSVNKGKTFAPVQTGEQAAQQSGEKVVKKSSSVLLAAEGGSPVSYSYELSWEMDDGDRNLRGLGDSCGFGSEFGYGGFIAKAGLSRSSYELQSHRLGGMMAGFLHKKPGAKPGVNCEDHLVMGMPAFPQKPDSCKLVTAPR